MAYELEKYSCHRISWSYPTPSISFSSTGEKISWKIKTESRTSLFGSCKRFAGRQKQLRACSLKNKLNRHTEPRHPTPIDEDWCDERNKFLRRWCEFHSLHTHLCMACLVSVISHGWCCIRSFWLPTISKVLRENRSRTTWWISNNTHPIHWPHTICAVSDFRCQQKKKTNVHSLLF